jgi:hypothetical protein
MVLPGLGHLSLPGRHRMPLPSEKNTTGTGENCIDTLSNYFTKQGKAWQGFR